MITKFITTTLFSFAILSQTATPSGGVSERDISIPVETQKDVRYVVTGDTFGTVADWEITIPEKDLVPEESIEELPVYSLTDTTVSFSPETDTQPTPIPQTGGPLTDGQMTFLGNCESGMNPTTNTGNGYYGAFQFSAGTWNSMNTGYGRADLAPLSVQKDAVQRLLARSSIWTQFPGCAYKMRAAGLI